MKINYLKTYDESGKILQKLKQAILDFDAKTICDIGGGANPLLPIDFIKQHNLDCTVIDLSQSELDKAPQEYRKVQMDILDSSKIIDESWDVVYSRALAEHVKDGEAFHRNIFRALKPGGIAFHVIPTLYSVPFVANVMMPEKLSSKVLDLVAPRDRYQHAKFPAYYSWCYGPTPKMLKGLTDIGYEITCFDALFGHRYYSRIKPVQIMHEKFTNYLVKHPTPYLTSYAHILLRKPQSS